MAVHGRSVLQKRGVEGRKIIQTVKTVHVRHSAKVQGIWRILPWLIGLRQNRTSTRALIANLKKKKKTSHSLGFTVPTSVPETWPCTCSWWGRGMTSFYNWFQETGSEEEKTCFKTSDKDGNIGRLRDVSPSQGLLQSATDWRSPWEGETSLNLQETGICAEKRLWILALCLTYATRLLLGTLKKPVAPKHGIIRTLEICTRSSSHHNRNGGLRRWQVEDLCARSSAPGAEGVNLWAHGNQLSRGSRRLWRQVKGRN